MAKPNVLPPTNRRAAWARPFWEGLSSGKLRCQLCGGCGAKLFPPRPCCPECLSDRLGWTELCERATLHSWTEVRVAGPEFDTPFFLGLADLSGGIGRLAARILDADAARLEIGMAVRVVPVSTGADFDAYGLVLEAASEDDS